MSSVTFGSMPFSIMEMAAFSCSACSPLRSCIVPVTMSLRPGSMLFSSQLTTGTVGSCPATPGMLKASLRALQRFCRYSMSRLFTSNSSTKS